jgi:hypothetical protein
VIDVSGSMQGMLSGKSDMRREDAANALAMVVRELSDTVSVYATGGKTVYVPSRHGFALADAIKNSRAGYDGIYLKSAMDFVAANEKGPIDRVIVFTDEQDCGHGNQGPQYAVTPGKRNYLINVASYRNGIGFGKWTKIDGFSESVIKYIIEAERVEYDNVS